MSGDMYYPLPPIVYSIELTYACKNKCPGCANAWNKYHKKYMIHWQSILDRIAPPDHYHKYAELIRISGGEPTLHNEFSSIVRYIDQMNIPHALFTCGRWNTPDHVIDCYQSCKNFTGMLISLHGHTEESHQKFVQSKEQHIFKEICNNTKRATQAGLTVFTNTVLTTFNCEHVDEIIQLSKNLGAECAVFNRFIGFCPGMQPSTVQLKNALTQIKSYDPTMCHLGNCVPQCFFLNQSEPAIAGFEHCAVSPDGWVRPDNLTTRFFGNILHESIDNIWQSQPAQDYRSVIHKDCLKCTELMNCRGGERSEIVEYGLDKDRLMTSPIERSEQQSVFLDPQWQPMPLFRVRKHAEGLILTRYNLSLPVAKQMLELLEAMNGQNNIADLQHQFGDSVLKVIGFLAKKGFVHFH